MDSYPHSIQELLECYGLSFYDLYLLCIFCDNLLTYADCDHFEYAELNLVWRNGWPYGVCKSCCSRAGHWECVRFYQFSMLGNDVESHTGCTLLQLSVRCYACLKKLNLTEKLEHVWKGVAFHCVKDRWKGICNNCRNAWAQAHN
ncbi:E6 [Bovine papillomavirus]|uniref:Protein E6 n=1 Tax=Bovine papillomavirus TaxID=10571 RepID=A0A1Z3FWE0_9PAPI|nr:E6 [Bovine papillomavirus]ASC49548.1 E6 [Bovine papillomavirus]